MWTAIGLTLAFICLLLVVTSLAKKYGEASKETDMRKYELERMAKEQARANKIINTVRNAGPDASRQWMQNNRCK